MISREPQINLKITCPGCTQKLDASGVPPFTSVDCPSCGFQIVTPRRFGQYLLEQPIREDTFCGLYRALDLKLDREVAVKALDRSQIADVELIEAFQSTVRRAAVVNQHNIVPIYSSGDYEDLPFLVMEWMPGGSAADLLVKEGKLGVASVLQFAVDATRALEAASREGMLHLDLKPENLLVGADKSIKVNDFGMAQIGAQGPGGRQPCCYASPEQLAGEPVDFRSDIFGLGATLYHLLTGVPPFSEDLTVRLSDLHAPPAKSPAQWRQNLPRGLSDLIMHMVAPAPEDRPGSYKALMGLLSQQQTRLRVAGGAGGSKKAVRTAKAVRRPVRPNKGALVQAKVADVRAKRRHRQVLDVVILLCLLALIVLFLVAAKQRPQWYVNHVEKHFVWATYRVGLDRPQPRVASLADGSVRGRAGTSRDDAGLPPEDVVPTVPTPSQPPVDMGSRPRPPDLDFSGVQEELRDYLRRQPDDLRELETERIQRLNKAKPYLLQLLDYAPFKGSQGIQLADGKRLGGDVVSFNATVLAVQLERGRDRPVQVRWNQLAPEQYFRFFQYYIDKRLDAGDVDAGALQGGEPRADAARDYVLLALLADWFGDIEKARGYSRSAVELDPAMAADIARFLYYL